MNNKQKEAVQRITAQYVAEVQAGHKPQAVAIFPSVFRIAIESANTPIEQTIN